MAKRWRMQLMSIGVIAVACAALPLLAGLRQTLRPVQALQASQSAQPMRSAQPIQRNDKLMDYLIQNVCVDAADRPVVGDPAICPRHRDLEVGERLPYVVTDHDASIGRSLSSHSSIPAIGVDGKLKIVVAKSLQGG